MATFVHDGKSIDYTPGAAVTAGDVVVQGELVGVAKVDIPASTLGALAVVGVFDFPKATGAGTGIAAGANCYWDVADGEAKTDAEGGANKLIGKCVRAAADADETVRIRMSQ
jgi:predicted RecA/RadA family phage recombinase